MIMLNTEIVLGQRFRLSHSLPVIDLTVCLRNDDHGHKMRNWESHSGHVTWKFYIYEDQHRESILLCYDTLVRHVDTVQEFSNILVPHSADAMNGSRYMKTT